MKESEESKKYSRRDMLKMSLLTGAGVAVSASGIGGAVAAMGGLGSKKATAEPHEDDDAISFYGKHQAGIITPQQTYLYLASFTLLTDDKKAVISLFKKWTEMAAAMSAGSVNETYGNDWLPPSDTGEAVDLSAARLTMTFGFGRTFFEKNGKDRFGIASKKPKHLQDIPPMPRDDLQEPFVGGDVCIQVCADDQQVAFHAIRNFIKSSVGKAELKWMQSGFISGKEGMTPRNLFGFKDGTANAASTNTRAHDQIIWANQGEPDWMQGGSYMACRKIKMFLEVWDRSSLKDQEDTFGRKKDSGAPYGKAKEHDKVNLSQLPKTSHTAIAKGSGQQIYRRAYSYTDGVDAKTGYVDAGLMFIAYQKNPTQQFLPMLLMLSKQDKLNEYTKHIGSAMFACPKGIKKGSYIGKELLEA
ncbi:iron uptake transporter deferrochelatase/peroxidase subunit [Priestia koreensis]|uniref:iron uptake transporter deferrochelatase/peroxidase subunit n=1 Tax=Priestia koreensis TaxID=284581 RepID=UPI003457C017